MITAVLVNPVLFRLLHTINRSVCCIKLKVHSTKYVVFQNITAVLLLLNRFSPSRLVPVNKCLQFIENMLCVKHNNTVIAILLWQPAVILLWKNG